MTVPGKPVIIGGGILVVHGIDVAAAGFRQVWTGELQRTVTSQAVEAVTGSACAGEMVDMGISIGGSMWAASRIMAMRSGAMLVDDFADDALKTLGKTSDDYVTVYRGDRAGLRMMESKAVRSNGFSGAKRLIRDGNLDDLMYKHAMSSDLPPSPFISVTRDPRVARHFAGKTGVVYKMKLHNSRLIRNRFNNLSVKVSPNVYIPEDEYLVPLLIRRGEIVR